MRRRPQKDGATTWCSSSPLIFFFKFVALQKLRFFLSPHGKCESFLLSYLHSYACCSRAFFFMLSRRTEKGLEVAPSTGVLGPSAVAEVSNFKKRSNRKREGKKKEKQTSQLSLNGFPEASHEESFKSLVHNFFLANDVFLFFTVPVGFSAVVVLRESSFCPVFSPVKIALKPGVECRGSWMVVFCCQRRQQHHHQRQLQQSRPEVGGAIVVALLSS